MAAMVRIAGERKKKEGGEANESGHAGAVCMTGGPPLSEGMSAPCPVPSKLGGPLGGAEHGPDMASDRGGPPVIHTAPMRPIPLPLHCRPRRRNSHSSLHFPNPCAATTISSPSVTMPPRAIGLPKPKGSRKPPASSQPKKKPMKREPQEYSVPLKKVPLSQGDLLSAVSHLRQMRRLKAKDKAAG